MLQSTYTATANDDGIILRYNGLNNTQNQVTLPYNSFRNIAAKPLTASPGRSLGDNFKLFQQQFNYLDSIKDKTNWATMLQLDIYPEAGADGPKYLGAGGGGKDLDKMKWAFLRFAKPNISRTTWIKIKNSNNRLDPKKIYDTCFWDAGISGERIIQTSGGGGVPTYASIGTLIDPAAGKSAVKIANQPHFPKNSTSGVTESIVFDGKFMEAIGFGAYSYINAITNQASNVAPFNYTMNVGCGTNCVSGTDKCVISNTSTHSLEHYTIGNKQKKAQIEGDSQTEEKVKYIVLKEWGDKIQVMCHLLKFYLHDKQANLKTTLLTGDYPVYVLCIYLSIPCIFTGAVPSPVFRRPVNIPPDRTFYQILEYFPGDPRERMLKRIIEIRDNIYNENQTFKNGIDTIKTSRIPVMLGGQYYVVPDVFYDQVLSDLNTIELANEQMYGQPTTHTTCFVTSPPSSCPPFLNDLIAILYPNNNISSTWDVQEATSLEENIIYQMKGDCLFIRFIKNVKYTSQSLDQRRRKSKKKQGSPKLKFMTLQNYTGNKQYGGYASSSTNQKGAFKNIAYILVKNDKVAPTLRVGGGQKGGMNGDGEGETKTHMEVDTTETFPVSSEDDNDDDDSVYENISADFWSTYFPGDWSQPVWYSDGKATHGYLEGWNAKEGITAKRKAKGGVEMKEGDRKNKFIEKGTVYSFDDTEFENSDLLKSSPKSAVPNVDRINLTFILYESFVDTINDFIESIIVAANNQNVDMDLLEDEINGFAATIYTKYCYNAYIDDYNSKKFTLEDLGKLIEECEIDTSNTPWLTFTNAIGSPLEKKAAALAAKRGKKSTLLQKMKQFGAKMRKGKTRLNRRRFNFQRGIYGGQKKERKETRRRRRRKRKTIRRRRRKKKKTIKRRRKRGRKTRRK